ncbi:hypothetical protein [Acinetobacter larvae]|uniref:DUF4179 domain-containing protein n=1 Tax=Acinetobacter larvae TaxID=1789224 RepID=A0A1B2M2P1_9GAMM|nr:hypothetical protein [Acinetobacter larvae]AOA59454.1 hypothetical protein BFG52_14580 [Acinetobacter larvae]
MKSKILKVHFFVLLALGFAVTAQANAIRHCTPTPHAAKISPIEKALIQQKCNNQHHRDQDRLKLMTNLKVEPTQNFLAEQHQRFSRFIQSIFQPAQNS